MGKPPLTAVVIWALLTPLLLTCVLQERELFKRVAFRGVSTRTPLHRMTGDRQVDCSVACARLPACLSFSFRPGPQGCSLYPRRTSLLDIDFSLNATDLHFWKLLKTCPSEKGYAVFPGTNACLRYVSAHRSWPAAEEICQGDGGHLAIISNAETLQAVTAYVASDPSFTALHVGATDSLEESHFLWLDGSDVNMDYFVPGVLTDNGANNGQDCVSVFSNGLRDIRCVHGFPSSLCSLPIEA